MPFVIFRKDCIAEKDCIWSLPGQIVDNSVVGPRGSALLDFELLGSIWEAQGMEVAAAWLQWASISFHFVPNKLKWMHNTHRVSVVFLNRAACGASKQKCRARGRMMAAYRGEIAALIIIHSENLKLLCCPAANSFLLSTSTCCLLAPARV